MFRRKKRLNWLLSQYGEVPDTFYYDGDMDRIQRYYSHKKENESQLFFIDDITWNDLEMDEIYKSLNNALTTEGEQLLYYQLRCPATCEKDFMSRKHRVVSIENNADLRTKLQMILARLGKNRVANLTGTFHPLPHSILLLIVSIISILLLLGSVLGIALSSFFIIPMLFFLVWNPLFHVFMMKRLHTNLPHVNHAVSLIAAAQKIKKHLPSDSILWTNKVQTALGKVSGLTNIGLISSVTDNELSQFMNGFLLIDIITCELLKNRLAKLHNEILVIHEHLGQIDAAIAIASYRKSRETVCTPEVIFNTKEEPFIAIQAMVHPFLSHAIQNDIKLEQSLLITGSNATGKSTFLKSLIINSIMAQGIITAACDKYEATSFQMYSSMAIRDSISTGDSYFIAEIKSLKRILDHAMESSRVLCIIDEVLRGTNTVERIAASSELLSALATKDVICVAATHDIEMCDLLKKKYQLGHFSEQIINGQIQFDYKLKTGPSRSRNAIKLLELLGVDGTIVRKANQKAERFMQLGNWA